MKNIIIFAFAVFVNMSVLAQGYSVRGILKDIAGEPVAGAEIMASEPRSAVMIKTSVSNGEGAFSLTNIQQGQIKLNISFIGMKEYSAELVIDKNIDLGTIVLIDSLNTLDEVIVTAKMVETFADKTIYRLKTIEKKSYNSALRALEVVPKIQVMDQQISLINGKSVKVLINGAPSDATDLSTISPHDILSIDFYEHPPARFANLGLGGVVNVILKQQERGGTLGLNLQNALTTGFGNDVVNFRYNWGNSQMGIKYYMRYRDYDKRILDENLQYVFDGNAYHKEKKGKDSPYKYEDQLAEVNWTNQKSEDYTLNLKLNLKSFNRRRTSLQNINARINEEQVQSKEGSSIDNDKYIRPTVDLYFDKLFNKKNEFIFNIVGTYYQSEYDYQYKEIYNNEDDFETFTYINGDKYSLISDALYKYYFNGRKQSFSVGTRYMYHTSKQKNNAISSTSLSDNNSEMYAYTEFRGILGKEFRYSVSAGLNYNSFESSVLDKTYDYIYFRPSVSGSYSVNNKSDIVFNYNVNTITPSLSELSNNLYYRDVKYVYTGNPNLEPYNQHNITLSYNYRNKRVMSVSNASYIYAKNPIAPVFTNKNLYITESFGNLNSLRSYKLSSFLQYSPFRSNILRFRVYAEVFHEQYELGEKKWNHTDLSVIPSIFLSYKKWSFQIFHQTSTMHLSGQMLNMRPQMTFLELSYRPMQQLMLTGAIRYPFYHAWEISSETYASDIINRYESEQVVNNANMIYVNVVYRFSFGKTKPESKQKLSNEDKDSGILKRIK